MKIFGLNELLGLDNKGLIDGSYSSSELMKDEVIFETSAIHKRPFLYLAGKVFVSDGNKLVQYNISKFKTDTTFLLPAQVTAVEALDQDVSLFLNEIILATKDGQLWQKKFGKDAKEFKNFKLDGLNLLENFSPSILKVVPTLNTLVSNINQLIVSGDLLISATLETETINFIIDADTAITSVRPLTTGDILLGIQI